MGMDVYGRNPDADVGEYFRRNVWGWHPLAEAVEAVCSMAEEEDLFNRCEHWHTNDGDGLNAVDSIELADLLEDYITSGMLAAHLEIREERLAAMPNDPCRHCNGTGIRDDEVGKRAGQPGKLIPTDAIDTTTPDGKPHPRAGQTGWCNGCDGTGYNRPWDCHYHVDLDDVKQFAEFLRHCGGFEIC